MRRRSAGRETLRRPRAAAARRVEPTHRTPLKGQTQGVRRTRIHPDDNASLSVDLHAPRYGPQACFHDANPGSTSRGSANGAAPSIGLPSIWRWAPSSVFTAIWPTAAFQRARPRSAGWRLSAGKSERSSAARKCFSASTCRPRAHSALARSSSTEPRAAIAKDRSKSVRACS